MLWLNEQCAACQESALVMPECAILLLIICVCLSACVCACVCDVDKGAC